VVVTGKGWKTRRVPLFDRAVRALADLSRPKFGDYVFWWARGRRFIDLRRSFNAACERARIGDLVWHDLRRTCGCRLLQDHNVRLEDVQIWLGHSSIKTTERHYAFLREESLSSIVQRQRGVVRKEHSAVLTIPPCCSV
jgi:integrase/recombinase XerD